MTILNFSHPLTPAQLAATEQLTAQTVDPVLDIETQFDPEMPFVEQARALMDLIGLSAEES